MYIDIINNNNITAIFVKNNNVIIIIYIINNNNNDDVIENFINDNNNNNIDRGYQYDGAIELLCNVNNQQQQQHQQQQQQQLHNNKPWCAVAYWECSKLIGQQSFNHSTSYVNIFQQSKFQKEFQQHQQQHQQHQQLQQRKQQRQLVKNLHTKLDSPSLSSSSSLNYKIERKKERIKKSLSSSTVALISSSSSSFSSLSSSSSTSSSSSSRIFNGEMICLEVMQSSPCSDAAILKCRPKIGMGVVMCRQENNGRVWLHNRTKYPIFVSKSEDTAKRIHGRRCCCLCCCCSCECLYNCNCCWCGSNFNELSNFNVNNINNQCICNNNGDDDNNVNDSFGINDDYYASNSHHRQQHYSLCSKDKDNNNNKNCNNNNNDISKHTVNKNSKSWKNPCDNYKPKVSKWGLKVTKLLPGHCMKIHDPNPTIDGTKRNCCCCCYCCCHANKRITTNNKRQTDRCCPCHKNHDCCRSESRGCRGKQSFPSNQNCHGCVTNCGNQSSSYDEFPRSDNGRYCSSVQVSFAKGFGREYTRQSILYCPCWFEVLFNISEGVVD
ncbi:hypothetical protein HELRODRAFT_172026 [Helobdella robusta]|uniref:MH2 domain-containing protein n=1 Tax=Helobdella robusta TaxID=6412 RepID=T1F4Y5_HELRO|nr:hypothetical protein HELRODRAFT_172026 [Helobdella robusta]ESO05013.1 hypothetical protein HELRODRAFT_172026 [Helobdella robusta]